jgi:hypothetical protein
MRWLREGTSVVGHPLPQPAAPSTVADKGNETRRMAVNFAEQPDSLRKPQVLFLIWRPSPD